MKLAISRGSIITSFRILADSVLIDASIFFTFSWDFCDRARTLSEQFYHIWVITKTAIPLAAHFLALCFAFVLIAISVILETSVDAGRKKQEAC